MGIVSTVKDWATRTAGRALGVSDRNEVSWPPESEGPRLRRYAFNEDQYRNAREREEQRCRDAGKPTPISLAMYEVITDTLAGRLFGEPVAIAAPADEVTDEGGNISTQASASHEFLDFIATRNRIQQLFTCGAQEASFCGDAVFQVRYDATRLAIIIERIAPETWFPETDPLDSTHIAAHVIGQVLHQGEEAYLWQTRHEMRGEQSWITNRVWRLEEGDSGYTYDPARDEVALDSVEALAGIPAEQATGIDEMLVVHVPNRRIAGDVYGVDDYSHLHSMIGEVNNRVSQRADVLDKFVDPVFWGPPPPITGNGVVDMLAQKYLPVLPDSPTPPAGTIVWDAELTAVTEHIRQLTEQIAAGAGIDLVVLVPQIQGAPASGRALRLGQMRTQGTVQLRQQTWTPGIETLMSVATKLAVAPGVKLKWQPTSGTIAPLEPEDVTVTFSDGLPSDEIEQTQVETERIAAKIQSRKRAIMALDGVDEAEAEARVQEIDEEAMAGEHVDSAIGTFGGALPETNFLGITQPAAPAPPAEAVAPAAAPVEPEE